MESPRGVAPSAKSITYADLERVLTQLGFVVERPAHTYEVFRYPALEIMIVLPARHGNDAVDAAHLMAVRTHVVANGLLEATAFDALLRGAEPTAASQ